MNSDLTVIESINARLHREFRVLDGRPIYRLVYSEDQWEMRKGKYSDFYGKIFLREYEAVKPVRKYWYFQQPCWVLEKLVFVTKKEALKEMQKELVQMEGSIYQHVYSFVDADSNPLEVNDKVVDIILYTLHNPGPKLTESDMRIRALKEELLETKYFEEKIGEDERSPLFVFENSAFVSTNQLKYKKQFEQTLREKPDGIIQAV